MRCRNVASTRIVLPLALVLVGATLSLAAPPWLSLVPFRKVEADPQKSYKLTKENGPWMIMAISFSNDEAEEEARKLALELRRDFKLETYIHEQEVNLEDKVTGLGVDEYGNPKQMKYLHGGNSREVAVLVGNFNSFDDPEATKTLEKIRYLRPKSFGLSAPDRDETYSANHLRAFYRRVTSNNEQKKRGPLGKAFITRNPMLPADDVAKQSLDPFVEDLNKGIQYSLLGNKGQYTVQIATYRGVASFNEKEFNESMLKNGDKPKIDRAAENATLITATLRKQGVEAYVFHDRHESIVTVGSFNDLGTEMASGRTELQPEIAKVIKQFEASRNSIAGTDQLGLQPKVIANVPIDVSPRLIVVPRKSIADVYRQ
jgi:hypothetical protein